MITKPKTIVFIGDSITDAGNRSTSGHGLGNGFVQFLSLLVQCRNPCQPYNFINSGIGGNTLFDIRGRWVDDVIDYRPDTIHLLAGINDVHRYLADPAANEVYSPESCQKILASLLDMTREILPDCRICITSPFFASKEIPDPGAVSFRARVAHYLMKYISGLRSVSEKYNTGWLDMQTQFTELFRDAPRSKFFPDDPVHPSPAGHMFMAEKIYPNIFT